METSLYFLAEIVSCSNSTPDHGFPGPGNKKPYRAKSGIAFTPSSLNFSPMEQVMAVTGAERKE